MSPGPGAYNARYRAAVKGSPGWKIGTSKRNEDEQKFRRTGHHPDPLTYSPDPAAASRKMASWSFGSG